MNNQTLPDRHRCPARFLENRHHRASMSDRSPTHPRSSSNIWRPTAAPPSGSSASEGHRQKVQSLHGPPLFVAEIDASPAADERRVIPLAQFLLLFTFIMRRVHIRRLDIHHR